MMCTVSEHTVRTKGSWFFMELVKVFLASLLSFAVLFICAKLVGRKQIAQLNFIDYITGITIGSIAAELATELEAPMRPLIAMGVYAVATWAMARFGMRCMRARKFIDGTPTIILRGGKLYRDNMNKAKLDLSEFMVMCREQGYFSLSDIDTAIFEYNGKLTILPVSARRPATLQDMGLTPQQETISVEVIMDGRILGENLHRMGLDETWLARQLHKQGIRDARDVFLAVCDDHKQLTCYPMKP